MVSRNDDSSWYRIVGFGPNGSRHVIGEGLNRDQVAAVFLRFVDSPVYSSISVEHGDFAVLPAANFHPGDFLMTRAAATSARPATCSRNSSSSPAKKGLTKR